MRVLISGGGIAGPALAFWLHRAGAEVTVVEQAPAPRPGGQTIDVRGAARDVIGRMGLAAEIDANRVDERGLALVDADDRRIAEMSADLFGGEGIVAEIEISRGDLARILYDATRTTATYRFGDRITALAQDPDGVDVTFASGGTERFDIVAGADGVHSGVRALAFGPESEFVSNLGGYGCFFTVPDPGDLGHWFSMYNAPGGRVAGLRPYRNGQAQASMSFRTRTEYGRLTVDRQKAVVAEHLAGAGWRVPSFLAAMTDAPDFYFDSISRVDVAEWHRGRVVLIGDAGYCGSPLGGHGTSLSVVGAYVLAGELARAATPGEAFTAYQAEMADYVKTNTALPPGGMRSFAPKSALAIRMRAASMQMVSHWPMKALMAKEFSKADAITLKDYALTPAAPR